jgi:hypothetical protein
VEREKTRPLRRSGKWSCFSACYCYAIGPRWARSTAGGGRWPASLVCVLWTGRSCAGDGRGGIQTRGRARGPEKGSLDALVLGARPWKVFGGGPKLGANEVMEVFASLENHGPNGLPAPWQIYMFSRALSILAPVLFLIESKRS